MACIFNNPIYKDQPSKLHEELLSYFSDENQADRIYNITLTDSFIELFGNWLEDTESVEGRVTEFGEPKLRENIHGRKYFTLADDSKLFLDKPLSNLNYLQRQALVTNSIEYLLGSLTLSKEDITQIDFSDLYNTDKEGEVNSAYYILQGKQESLKELEELVRMKLGVYSTNIQDREDYLEETITSIDDLENGKVLDLRQSFEKNSKDNASSNIKFLLSLVPKQQFNESGEIELVTESFTLEDGSVVELPIYNDFHEIWNYFEESLAGIYPKPTGSTFKDLYNQMINKLVSDYEGVNATVMYTVNNLLVDLPDWKKNQFVQAFLKSRVNFYTVTIDQEGNKRNLTYFDSSSPTSRQNKVKKELIDGLSSSNLFDNTKKQFNNNAAKKIAQRHSEVLEKATKEYNKDNFDSDNYFQVADYIINELEKLNIQVGKPSVISYLNSFSEDYFSNVIKGLTELQLMLNSLSKMDSKDFYLKDRFVNPLSGEKIINKLSEAESTFRKDISENTILGPDNKRYWVYALPSYLDIKLDRLKSNLENEIGQSAFYKNSYWIKNFKATPKSLENMQILTFNNLKLERQGDAGVDNKDVTEIDQLADILNKTVLIKRSDYDYSIYNTPAPADKGRSLAIKTNMFVSTNLQINEDGSYKFSDEVKNIYKGYFIDEYRRIREVYDRVKEDDSKGLVQYYHYDPKNPNKLFKEYKGKQIPAGNGFKFTLFNDLNYDSDIFEDINLSITNENGVPLFNTSDEGDYLYPHLDSESLFKNKNLDKYINKKLTEAVNNTINFLTTQELVNKTLTKHEFIDNKIFEAYLSETSNGKDRQLAITKFVADSVLNQHIANVEYSKVFSGDYSFYKSLEDYSKRVPATYTDGTLLNLKESDPIHYKMAVIEDVEVPTELYPDKQVNTTDAQGWITLDRWKFLMSRLNKWNPVYEEAYKRMTNGEETPEDYKLAAQPLKGVYFDNIDGVPTYVKYSQAVLIPSIIKGESIESLYNKMIEQNIDEVVTLSGVKVGAPTVTKVNDEIGFIKDLELKPVLLNNHSWKLQQDLSPKGIKDTLLGSQMQKNILGDIQFEEDYNGKTGRQRVDTVNNIISKLSDLGLEELSSEIGLNPSTGEISNREVFHTKLIEEIAARDGDYNTIEALKKEYPLDLILTNRIKFQNLVASMINTATVRLKTNGGSFIQMSGFGWDITDAENNGIKMLVDTDELQAPRKVKDLNTGRDKVLPGQVFITHQEVVKYIPNYRELSDAELKSRIDDKLRYIIGYRIPNQALASNDVLEVVGILPSSMGDTIIPYIDITTKTGSDFDIDKMYVMMPHSIYNEESGTLEFYQDKEGKETRRGLENRLLEEYKEILTSSINFENLTNALDNDFLKDDIETLHGKDEVTNGFEFFSPTYQLRKKFDNMAGKAGTGITANHVSDHNFAQIVGLSINEDLGVGNYNKETETTSLSAIYDSENKNKISEVLSWFLTAYVDIAKDPYITKGNYNNATSNVAFLLIRAGAPINWVNRFIGQPILKEYAQMELSKNSRFLGKKRGTYRKLKNEYIKYIKDIKGQKYVDELNKKLEEYSNGFVIEKDKQFKVKFLEKQLKLTPSNEEDRVKQYEAQLAYLEAFNWYNDIGNKFNSTVVNSKADVNGSPSNIVENIIYQDRVKKMFNYKSSRSSLEESIPLFNNLQEKFDKTFLGTKHKNSVDLVSKIYEKEFVTASPFGKEAINRFLKINENLPELSKLTKQFESHLFGYIASKSGFFQMNVEDIADMFRIQRKSRIKDSIQKRVLEARKTYPENVLLQTLKPYTQGEYQFLTMDNLTNKPSTFKNDLTLAWEELQYQDRELSEDLLKYSFLSSNFVFNSNSFFEYAPNSLVKEVIKDVVKEFKDFDKEGYINEAFFYYYKNNPDMVPLARLNDSYPGANDKTASIIANTEGSLIISRSMTSPMIKTSTGMYRAIAQREEEKGKTTLYRKIQTFGYHENNFHIYDNLTREDIYTKVSKATENKIDEYIFSEYFEKLPELIEAETIEVEETPLSVTRNQRVINEESTEIVNEEYADKQAAIMENKFTNLGVKTQFFYDTTIDVSGKLLGTSDPLYKKLLSENSIEPNTAVIVVNPNKLYADTVFHEYGHLFIELLGGMSNGRLQEAYTQLVDTQLAKDVIAAYPELEGENLQKEIITTALGKKANELFINNQQQSWWKRFIEWFKNLVNRTLGLPKDVITELASEFISDEKVILSKNTFLPDQTQFLKDKEEEFKTKNIVERTLNSLEDIRREIYSTIELQLRNLPSNKNMSQIQASHKETLMRMQQELNKLDKTENVTALSVYLDYIDKKLKGFEKAIEDDIIKYGKDSSGVVKLLHNFSKTIDSFGLIKDIQRAFNLQHLEDSKEFTSLEQREELINSIDNISSRFGNLKSKIQGVGTRHLSKIFAAYSNKATVQRKEQLEIEANKQGLKGEERTKFIEDTIEQERESLQQKEYELVFKSLSESSFDITAIAKWITDEKDINNMSIQLVTKIMDDADIQRDFNTNELEKKASKIFNRFRKEASGTDPKRIYQGFYEEGSDGQLYLTGQYKVDFYIQYNKLKQATVEAEEEHGTESEQYQKAIEQFNKFKKENIIVNKTGPIYNIKPTSKWINPNYGKIRNTELYQFLVETTELIDRNLNGTQSNVKYFADLKYYKLPSIGKRGFEQLASGNLLDNMWESIQRIWKVRQDNTEFGNVDVDKQSRAKQLKVEIERRLKAGEDISELSKEINMLAVLTNEIGDIKQQVPIHFRGQHNLKDQSYDLMSILVMDHHMSENFRQKKLIQPSLELVMDIVNNQKFKKTQGFQKKLLVHAYGKDTYEAVRETIGSESNVGQLLQSIIGNRLYGIRTINTEFAQVANNLMAWTGMAMLGFNFLAASANLVQGKTYNFIESFGGQWFNRKNLIAGETVFLSDMRGWLDDTGRPVQTSKTNQLMKIFNIQGEFKGLSHRFNEDNRFKALMNRSSLFFMNHMGEFYLHATLMYSILDNIKVKNDKGEYIDKNGKVVSKDKAMNLHQAISVDKEGNLLLDQRVKKTSFGNEEISFDLKKDKGILEVRNLINKIANDVHGQYNEEYQSMAQRHIVGKMVFMLRKWVVRGFNRRWRGANVAFRRKELLEEKDRFYSEDLQSYQEGYYTSFLRFISRLVQDYQRLGLSGAWKDGLENMTDAEKANLRKTTMELGMMALTLIASIFAVKQLDGLDEDDDELLLFLTFLNRRLYSELSFFANPISTFQILRSPAASVSYAQDIMELLSQIVTDGYNITAGNGLELYERGKNKGLPKVWKRTTDLLPILNHMNRSVYESTSYIYNAR